MLKIAVIFHRLGPYHVARLNATACDALETITAIELSAKSSLYGWDPVDSGTNFNRVTVTADDNKITTGQFKTKLAKVLDDLKPEVVFVSGWSGARAIEPLEWCLQNQVPAIVMSESSAKDAGRMKFVESLKSQVVAGFTAGLVGGTRHREYLSSLGMPMDAIQCGYDAIDNHYFEEQSIQARIEQSNVRVRLNLPERYFLTSSRFVVKKNLPSILVAFSEYVAQASSPHHLVMLGDGPLRDELFDLARQLNLEKLVHFPGFRQYHDLPSYYALATAFIHASRVEQWGLVVNEAMACGLPVVVSDACGCSPELVHDNVNGFSFSPNDTARLAEIMGFLANNETKCQEFGVSSRRIISDWGTERFAAGFWKAIRIAENAPPKRRTLARRFFLSLASWASQYSRVE